MLTKKGLYPWGCKSSYRNSPAFFSLKKISGGHFFPLPGRFLTQKPKINAAYIKPLTPAETNGAPYIRVTFAAKVTGLGLSVTRRLGTRRFGNADFVLVTAVNAFIAGETQPDEPKAISDPQPTPVNPNTQHFPPLVLITREIPLSQNFPPKAEPPSAEKKTPNHCQSAELSRRQLQQTQDDPAQLESKNICKPKNQSR
jgi:hypothetical protein